MNDERRANSEQRRKCVLDKSILHCRFIYGKDLLFRIGVWKPRKISLYWFITPICGVILLKESTVWKWRERNPRGISSRRGEREKWKKASFRMHPREWLCSSTIAHQLRISRGVEKNGKKKWKRMDPLYIVFSSSSRCWPHRIGRK